MNDYNYVAEACTELLRGKDVGFNIDGYVEDGYFSTYISSLGIRC